MLTFVRKLAIQDNPKGLKSVWLCNCGKEIITNTYSAKKGIKPHCGCEKKPSYYKHELFDVWKHMKARCDSATNHAYHYYGARGIKVCDRWYHFPNFIEDMGERPTSRHQLDRKNNNRGYFKDNCRWATSKQNQRNKRDTVYVEYFGDSVCLADYAEEKGFKLSRLYNHCIVKGLKLEFYKPPLDSLIAVRFDLDK